MTVSAAATAAGSQLPACLWLILGSASEGCPSVACSGHLQLPLPAAAVVRSLVHKALDYGVPEQNILGIRSVLEPLAWRLSGRSLLHLCAMC